VEIKDKVLCLNHVCYTTKKDIPNTFAIFGMLLEPAGSPLQEAARHKCKL